jgi:hypothetical protein
MNYCVTCHTLLTDRDSFVEHFDHKVQFGGERPMFLVYSDGWAVGLYEAVTGIFDASYEDERSAEQWCRMSNWVIVERLSYEEYLNIQVERMAV